MIKGTLEVSGLDLLQKRIDYVKKLKQMQIDKNFQDFIKRKCLETVIEVSKQRLQVGGGAEQCTNEEYFNEYIENHKIRDTDNGFIIYNDLTVPANTTKPENYPNGFSIAMAFEYGVGIVGENANDNPNAWAYNIHNYQFGWVFKKGEEFFATYGYAGFEIYRFSAIEIQKQLPIWVKNYFSK